MGMRGKKEKGKIEKAKEKKEGLREKSKERKTTRKKIR